MKILTLTNYWPPEVGASPGLTFQLAETLADFGHEVTVCTGMPRYNVKELPPEYEGQRRMSQTMGRNGNVRVERIATPMSYGDSRLKRGLVQLVNPRFIGRLGRTMPKPDVVFTVTPPLQMGLEAIRTARHFGVASVVNVQDLFPQSMVDLGILKNGTMIRTFERQERAMYEGADGIIVHGDGNLEHVRTRGARRAETINNWVDTEAIQPSERMNEFRREHGLGEEFIVSFAGTMGWTQGMEIIVQAARVLADEPDLRFLLVGDGVEKAKLQASADGLTNITWLPMQPPSKYPDVLAASDACLVTLRPEVLTPVVPSKMHGIMAAGRPVVASMPSVGDAPKIVAKSRSGTLSEAGDVAGLAESIRFLVRNREEAQAMGARGREHAVAEYSREACLRHFEAALQRAADSRM